MGGKGNKMFSPDFFASTKFTVLFLYKKMIQSLFHKILVRITCRRKKVLSFELSNSQFGALKFLSTQIQKKITPVSVIIKPRRHQQLLACTNAVVALVFGRPFRNKSVRASQDGEPGITATLVLHVAICHS